ncbi:acid ceramidase-like protein [Tieghemostelium lacteum]|uniref:Acid ceramidase-like protein n=1 Tax=Tieghemostelium lacteum TaxID=361077 RepID=A0A152A3U7_TIELA|nr:acid ceramidase-like protein [Tieghemostelium lacteum]|eukprot:KYR00879.1 acid ceramidase-like protein [Tieghemostelium lacteum]
MKQLFILLVIIVINLKGYDLICQGVNNNYTVWQENLVFEKSVTNGQLYWSGDVEAGFGVPVVHVYGTPYEMGYAHGQLLAEGIGFVNDNYLAYFESEIGSIGDLPKWVVELIDKYGFKMALDLVADASKPYTPSYFYEEMQGVADGSGLPLKDVVRFHMLPELVKASCSMFGAWDNAIPYQGEGLVHLRALDWDTTSPLTLKPVVLVYHPSEGNTFMTLSFQGFIGAITGYSGHTGISEKVWASYNGSDSRFGEPFYFVLRDILQFDKTVDQALNRIYGAHRTCSIYVGVGSNSSMTFTAVEYSYETVRIFDDVTPFPIYAPEYSPHELIPSVVYIDPDFYSADHQCMSNLLLKYYGTLTPENTIQIISHLQTGNLHAAIYDYYYNTFTFSVAGHNQTWPLTSNPTMAYNNQFIQLDVTSLFENKQ